MYIPVIGMGIVLAIYLLHDIHKTGCDQVFQNQNNSGINYTQCFRSIFIISFILTIAAIIAWIAQLIYNIIFRKRMNEEDPRYANIPQQQYADGGLVNNQAGRVASPTKTKKNKKAAAAAAAAQTGTDNRIA